MFVDGKKFSAKEKKFMFFFIVFWIFIYSLAYLFNFERYIEVDLNNKTINEPVQIQYIQKRQDWLLISDKDTTYRFFCYNLSDDICKTITNFNSADKIEYVVLPNTCSSQNNNRKTTGDCDAILIEATFHNDNKKYHYRVNEIFLNKQIENFKWGELFIKLSFSMLASAFLMLIINIFSKKPTV